MDCQQIHNTRFGRRKSFSVFAGCTAILSRRATCASQLVFDSLYTKEADAAVSRGLRFLAQRQTATGAMGDSRHSANAAIASLAGMAWLASGSVPKAGEFQASIQRQLGHVLKCVRSGGLVLEAEPSPGFGAMYGHGFSVLFLSELLGMADHPQLARAVGLAAGVIIASQNADGGWRYEPRPDDADVSVTSCQLIALRAAASAGVELPKQAVERGINYLLACRNSDGGFRYMLRDGDSEFSRTAACLTALHIAPEESPIRVSGGIDYLMKFIPGTAAAKRIQYYFYGHYYAAQATWHAGGDAWRAWFPAIRDELLAKQEPDGSWKDDICAEYGTAMACLILQIPLGYLPIYNR